ncbi:hypothetical protein WR25_13551 [Diploscapter pachys]|uniref:RRM domain-containing protein n=1 Tax=Diploscapter pachys TaxID=2018661 RepID=A0A2A2JCR9_9BILA|nr:hypothetical protein WR25_13551 [Diploscapter pachys]
MSRVYLGRLPYNVRERDIEKFLDGYGRIRSIAIKYGFAFVEFDDTRDADDAIHDLDGRCMPNSERTDVLVGAMRTSTPQTIIIETQGVVPEAVAAVVVARAAVRVTANDLEVALRDALAEVADPLAVVAQSIHFQSRPEIIRQAHFRDHKFRAASAVRPLSTSSPNRGHVPQVRVQAQPFEPELKIQAPPQLSLMLPLENTTTLLGRLSLAFAQREEKIAKEQEKITLRIAVQGSQALAQLRRLASTEEARCWFGIEITLSQLRNELGHSGIARLFRKSKNDRKSRSGSPMETNGKDKGDKRDVSGSPDRKTNGNGKDRSASPRSRSGSPRPARSGSADSRDKSPPSRSPSRD